MELFDKILKLVDTNFIFCLVPIVLTLILIELFFKNRFETKKVLNLIRWLIIIYTIITLFYSTIGIIAYPEEFAFTNRATGPYKVAYWLMLICAWVFPLTLLNKKWASKFWYVLLVSILIKIGFYFERFVIAVTSYHRDYLPEKGIMEWMSLPSFGNVMIFLQGFIIAILALGIFELIKRTTLKG